jgi:hypothetical protein
MRNAYRILTGKSEGSFERKILKTKVIDIGLESGD